MRYEEFKEAFTAEMMVRMEGSGIEVVPQDVSKVNIVSDALSFRRQDENVAALFYIEDAFHQHEEGRSVADIAQDVTRFMNERMNHVPDLPDINHDYIAKNLYLTVINADMNRGYLSEIPHETLEDMAVVPRVRVSEEASFAVKNGMPEQYGFTREELFRTAHANMEQLDYSCNDLGSVLFGFGMEPVMGAPSANIYVLTTSSGVDGAAAILSDKAMKDARAQIGEDFFILPSSRHEVLLVPRSMDMSVRELTDMVREVNRTAVEDQDLLSDNVYRYNSRSGSIKMVEPAAEVPEKNHSLPPLFM